MSTLISRPATPVYGAYTDGLRIQGALAKALSRALFNALPSDADAKERAAVQAVVDRADTLDVVFNARQDVGRVRTEFVELGQCFGGTYDALVAKARMPARLSTMGERASALIARVFSDGVPFVRWEAAAAWAEADRRCRRIVELGLVDELSAVIGVDHFDAMQRATAALGEAIGTGSTARSLPSRTGISDALYRFSRAVSRYARLLAAKVDEDDAASIERFREAVAPIDEYRSTRATRPAGDGDVDPDAPLDPGTPEAPIPNNGGGLPFMS